jgi:hypothetical protein
MEESFQVTCREGFKRNYKAISFSWNLFAQEDNLKL